MVVWLFDDNVHGLKSRSSDCMQVPLTAIGFEGPFAEAFGTRFAFFKMRLFLRKADRIVAGLSFL